MHEHEAVQRQQAFTALLQNPVLDRDRQPDLWRLVRRHRTTLTDWLAARLGYRLVVTDVAARLYRLPLGGEVIAPPRHQPPSRRVLVLAILAAAAAEDAEDVTTTQDLSDRVRALSTREDVDLAPYDPDRFHERSLFVRAVRMLVSVGALCPTGGDDEEQREGWAHRTDRVGGAYSVRRELLLRMVDPNGLRAALGGSDDDSEPLPEGTARFRLMRRLLERPVCLFDDLTEPERVYLSSQRHRILAWCAEMTGWVVEQRAEGIALIPTDTEDTDLPFPRLRAPDFFTLMVLDDLLHARDDSTVLTADVERVVADLRARFPKAVTNELKGTGATERVAIETLVALDLLRPTDQEGRWRLNAVAARFRNPQVVAVTARLDQDMQR